MTRRLWVVLVALLLSVVTMPMASAARGGTDRPVRATLSGTLTWDIDFDREVCPVVTKTEATGTMSHLGRVSASWRHCPGLTEEDPAYTNGHVVFTAANGDTVRGEYWDADGELPWTIDVVGGTGRFTQATGTLMLDWYDVVGEWGADGLPIEPWLWDATLSGTLSY